MFDTMVEIRERVADLAATFDPDLLTAGDCGRFVEHATAVERMIVHMKGLAAARYAETDLWRRSGSPSPADDLARRTGTSTSQAREQLAAAKRMRTQPEVDAAARAGRLSPQQAAAISDAAEADPAAAQRLVERAGQQSLGELRETCGRVKAAAIDPEERRRRILAARGLRTYTDCDGAFNLHLRHTPEVGAAVLEVLRPVQDGIFQAARAAGHREPAEAYAADALVEIITRSADGTSTDGDGAGDVTAKAVRTASRSAKVIVRVDLDTLLRGWPMDGELCEISGLGTVPVSVVEAMMATGHAFLTTVVTRGVDIIGVAHLGRKPTDHQVTAVQWKSPGCTALGCCHTRRIELDHRHDWSRTKVTLAEWLDPFCDHHHDLKTRFGWALLPGPGKQPMVPPDDPRHPRHAAASGDDRATGPPSRAA